MKILLVEDDQKIASFIVEGLNQAGYAVDAVIIHGLTLVVNCGERRSGLR